MELHLKAITALIGLGLLSSQASFGKDLSCTDWSFDNSHCPAYVASGHAASALPSGNLQPAQCTDWSFDDPHCAAHLSPSSHLASADPASAASPAGATCADWSFNDSACSAYIKR